MISTAVQIKIALALGAILTLLTAYFAYWKPRMDRADQLVQMQLQEVRAQQDAQKRADDAWRKAHRTQNWHFGPSLGDPNK
jgi:type II secretory pathway component PulM